MEKFNEGHMLGISRAAAALCVWVKAIEEYSQASKAGNPKYQPVEPIVEYQPVEPIVEKVRP
jgi:hypothetical protein